MPLPRMLGAATGKLLDLALPALCAGCGREGAALCPGCLPALDIRLSQPPGTLLGLPSDMPAPLLQLEWCSPFAGTARRALHQLKYAGERRLAEPLGAAIARRWARAGAGGDLLVPVPVHRDRARARGYDQAALLAEVAAHHLRLPFAPVLERQRATTAQYQLDRADRAQNVHDAFGLRDRPVASRAGSRPPTRSAEIVGGRWVVLVDDVVTTGATLAACAQALLRTGAIGVSAVTVARER